MKTFWIIVLVLAIGGAVYFSRRSSAPMPAMTTENTTQTQTETNQTPPPVANPETVPGRQTTPQPAQVPQTVSVNIKNFAFAPTTLSVKAGIKVTWTNNDSVAHTVTSDSGSTLNSGTIAPGASWSFAFATAGTYAYHCAFHPNMKASVTVTQ